MFFSPSRVFFFFPFPSFTSLGARGIAGWYQFVDTECFSLWVAYEYCGYIERFTLGNSSWGGWDFFGVSVVSFDHSFTFVLSCHHGGCGERPRFPTSRGRIDCFSALRVPFIWQANCSYWSVYGGWGPCNVGGWARLRLWEVAFLCGFAGLRFPSFLSLIPMGRAFSWDHRIIRTNGDVSNITRARLSERYEFQMCFPFCFPSGLSSSHALRSAERLRVAKSKW